jgi:acetate kinase
MDSSLNRGATGDRCEAIHSPASAAEVWVIPTDEGRVAAMQALEMLSQ